MANSNGKSLENWIWDAACSVLDYLKREVVKWAQYEHTA